MKAVYLIAASALALAGCNMDKDASAQSAGSTAPMSDPAMTPTTAMPFVAKAGASDLYEIQSSQVALTQSQNPAVKKFAQMLIDHHTMTTQQVTAAAQAAGMSPPTPMLEPMQQQMIATLQPLSGAAFDREYISQQIPAHQMALALHTNYAANGDTPSLKKAATKAKPIVAKHLAEANAMNKKMTSM
jgi:putative membrane protein